MSTDVALRADAGGLAPRAQHPEVTQLLLYWRGVVKRKWPILAFAVAASLLAALVSLAVTPVYRATATVLIEQNRARVIAIEEVYSGVSPNREHFETQAEILSSHTLASGVIARYNLTRHPEFDPQQRKWPFWRVALERIGVKLDQKPLSEKEIQAMVLDSFMRRTTVEPGRLNQLIRVSFDATDPQLAADMANAIVDTYIQNDIGTRSGMTKRASEWLNERLSALRKNLEQSESALQQYREREHLVDTKGLAQSGVSRQVEELTRALVDARQKRAQAEAAYQQTKSAANVDSLPVIQRNPLMTRFREIEADAEKKVAELGKRYGPEHPRMIQAQTELKQARDNRQKQAELATASLGSEYEAARSNEQAVEHALAEAKANVQAINRKEFQLGSLERAVATNRQIYETFLSRSKETSAANDVQGSAVGRVMDPALAPDTPLKPKKRQIVMIVFVLALFGAIGVALIREHLDDTLQTAGDVGDKLGRPLLAMLPLLSSKQVKHIATHYVDDPTSAFSEGIRTARTSVLLSGLGEPKKTVLITSSVSNEGKTAIAVNLALAHAHTQRVILLDVDLRQPSVATALQLAAEKPGLTDLLAGTATFAECLQRVNGSSLYAIASGPRPRDPLDLILSPRFHQLLKALASGCDVIIMDSPPIHLFSDAIALSTLTTGVVFVTKADSTPHHLARHCLQALHSVNAPVLGVILNQLDFRKADRYYGAYTGAYAEYYANSSTAEPHPRRLAPTPSRRVIERTHGLA